MTKITVPHIHKIEGEAGFWAEVTKTGKIEDLKIETLKGLRQIEGLLVGRRAQEVPLIVSRICGICPVVHILNACRALEKALDLKIPEDITLLRKLFLASQIIQSHTLHLFFLSLPDFFDIENELELMKRFKKETKAALKIRDFSLELTDIIGGRKVHPVTPRIGGFLRLPKIEDFKKVMSEYPEIMDSAQLLAKTFENLSYPEFQRETSFASLFPGKEYTFYQSNFILIDNKKSTISNFYSNGIEEDFKSPPVKRVKYQGKTYMLGAIARVRHNSEFLNPLAKKLFEDFKKKNKLSDKEFFGNIYHNLFCQAVEVLHFLEESQKLMKEIIESGIKEEKAEFQIREGEGISAMEAPRGTLFDHMKIDKDGRILECNIITPTAQFLANIEEDLKILLPEILKLSEKEKRRKIRALIRIYDPCISCAIH
jgi:coenzyme F420-reducing hydrogenase alpha subunit